MEKFRRFVEAGEVGLYNSCSITSVVLTSRKDSRYRNVFTIARFRRAALSELSPAVSY